ncbi:unnamed protein product [Rhizoctonia solani]|uniref:General transcription and DNA repair factor IIH subunit TFB4 n=2 Tax=Rhizoctonia solani TaxID=456999 RepID=A0A8H3E4K3_9AGAM|nr:unnamed protein product [Rhizoctonia solani]
METPESTPSAHLILIIDLSPVQWQLSASSTANGGQGMDLSTFLSQVLVFVNCHLACRQENSAAILGAFPGRSLTLYPAPPNNIKSNAGPGPEAEANTYHGFRSVDDALMDKIQSELAAVSELDAQKPIALVPSLTQALCQVNRVSAPERKLASEKPTSTSVSATDSRILILSVSPDASTPYIPFMNCIFSAQKLRVPIDVCRVFGSDTIFLQQAAYLTGGCYLNLDSGSSLIQSLTLHLVDVLPPFGIAPKYYRASKPGQGRLSVQSAPVREPEGLSTRRRSRAAEAAQQKQAEISLLKSEPVHEAPPSTDSNTIKITIRASRRKRQRLSTSTERTVPDIKPAVSEVVMPHPDPVPVSPAQPKRHRPPHLDARNSQFKRWVRIIRRARWIPGETAPGTPNPLPRQLVRQRAREYAANGVNPGSQLPEGMDSIYDVDWEEVLRTFDRSAPKDGVSVSSVPIEDLGEASTDSDSSLWDSD